MEGIKIYRRPRLKNPYLICAWPGMGEVAFQAGQYLLEQLKAEEFAEIESKDFFYPTGCVIENGVLDAPDLPYNKFYFYKNKTGKNDLIIFISNAQPDLSRAETYSQRITYIAKIFNVRMVVTFASMPSAIDHIQPPNVWFTATDERINNELKKYSLNHLTNGQISGMNGLFLSMAKKEGYPAFCLLGEIPLYTIQIENPKASHAVLSVLCGILNIQIDFKALIEQAHTLESEINKLLDYLKVGQTSGPIGEEDIERIKKSLSQLTKLPLSIKEKIDKLFIQAQKDISKAGTLKEELDKWNVYKEYEDRFLDLFKKGKDTNN